jgi:hypothetical protein
MTVQRTLCSACLEHALQPFRQRYHLIDLWDTAPESATFVHSLVLRFCWEQFDPASYDQLGQGRKGTLCLTLRH